MESAKAVAELLGMLLLEPRTGLLFALLVTAAVIDYRSYRIPNWLTFGGIAFALIYSLIVPFHREAGITWALWGLLVGFVVMLPLYALGVMGAGDVKLMAMVGAFLGLTDTVYALFFALIAGGVAALVVSLWRKSLLRMLRNVKDLLQVSAFSAMHGMRPQASLSPGESVGKLPYGVSICVGTLVYVVVKQLGYA